jgi:hypothetical protein
MPAQGLPTEKERQLVDGGRRLCEALRVIGYRGHLSADAIVTPRGEVLFTEYNGRVTGSTHIYAVIGEQVVGEGYGHDRLILERVWPSGWSTPSFAATIERLDGAGLSYDSAARRGVVLTNAYDAVYQGVMYCIVAEDLDVAWAIDRALKPLFS